MSHDKDDEPDEQARRAATDFAQRLTPAITHLLADDLIGAYLIGSLAHGGFSRRYSDVDVAILVEHDLTPAAIEEINTAARDASQDWAKKLSIFWADRRFQKGRLPPLDKMDLIEHGVALFERDKVRPDRVSLDEVREYLSGDPLRRWVENVRHLIDRDAIGPDDQKPIVRAHLYPARFVYSWQTGKMASNDDAVAFLHAGETAGLDLHLIDMALACRRAARDADELFTARDRLPAQVHACEALVKRSNPP